VKFGKLPYQYDPRTIKLGSLIRPDIRAPSKFDFDKSRFRIPLDALGSDQFRTDVLAAQAHQVIRMGRLREHRTISVSTTTVLDRYHKLKEFDQGLTALEAFRYWHRNPWKAGHGYGISAYGELDPLDSVQMRAAVFVLYGIFIGFWLPLAVKEMEEMWDYSGQTGKNWKPGALGGTLCYCKAYDQEGYEILAWGRKIRVTNEFVEKFSDEAWAVIGELDSTTTQVVDTAGLATALESRSSS